jgi:hypothetical protein
LGRLCYETKKYSQARSHYHQAFALYPRSLLKLSHLRKYLRCLVMR